MGHLTVSQITPHFPAHVVGPIAKETAKGIINTAKAIPEIVTAASVKTAASTVWSRLGDYAYQELHWMKPHLERGYEKVAKVCTPLLSAISHYTKKAGVFLTPYKNKAILFIKPYANQAITFLKPYAIRLTAIVKKGLYSIDAFARRHAPISTTRVKELTTLAIDNTKEFVKRDPITAALIVIIILVATLYLRRSARLWKELKEEKNNAIRAKVAALIATNEAHTKTATLEVDLETKNQRINDLTSQHRTLENDLSGSKANIATLTSEKASMASTIKREEENALTKTKTIEAGQEAKNQTISALKREQNMLKKELSTSKAKIAELEEQTSALTRQVTLEIDQDKKNQTIVDLTSENSTLKRALSQSKAKIKTLTSDNASMASTISLYDEHVESMKTTSTQKANMNITVQLEQGRVRDLLTQIGATPRTAAMEAGLEKNKEQGDADTNNDRITTPIELQQASPPKHAEGEIDANANSNRPTTPIELQQASPIKHEEGEIDANTDDVDGFQ